MAARPQRYGMQLATRSGNDISCKVQDAVNSRTCTYAACYHEGAQSQSRRKMPCRNALACALHDGTLRNVPGIGGRGPLLSASFASRSTLVIRHPSRHKGDTHISTALA